jgi:microsomal dipeptidase-like Zn-dependent dipeptidase
MENLSEQKQATIKNMSSDRIIKLLIDAGLDVEEIEAMSRENLMRALAEVWLKKGS